MVNKARLENGKISFVSFQTLFLHHKMKNEKMKNEKDGLLQDNINDEFAEENTSLSKGMKITPRGSEKWKEMSSKENEQEIKFLKVAT